MRNFIKTLYLWISSKLRIIKPGVYILNGHFLSRRESNDPQVFRKLLSTMVASNIKLINVEKALSMIETKDKISEAYVSFTFDDGFEDCYFSLAPVLEEFGVNACFFINPNFVEGNDEYIKNFTDEVVLTTQKKPMSWGQIIDLHNRGFIIGNHTLDHARLSRLPVEEVKLQIGKSREIIERKLRVKCEYFAWPYGQLSDFSQNALAIAEENHKYIFSGCEYKNYYSFDHKVLNRRHFEADWKFYKLKYFLTVERKYS